MEYGVVQEFGNCLYGSVSPFVCAIIFSIYLKFLLCTRVYFWVCKLNLLAVIFRTS